MLALRMSLPFLCWCMLAGCRSCALEAGGLGPELVGADRVGAAQAPASVPVVVTEPVPAKATKAGPALALSPVPAPMGPIPALPDPSASGHARDAESTPGHWAFRAEPDRFERTAMLDLRYLNEGEAGQHGFVRVDAQGDFRRGDGQPLRFWAVGSGDLGADVEAWAAHGRWLAKRGVNAVRWHGNLAPRRKGQALGELNQRARAELWACVAGMKRAGIYTVVSPFFPHRTRVQPGWGLDTERLSGLLFFEPRVQAAYKGWLRAALTPKNPHTGIALKDEPAVAILQMQNEDSLLFWTSDRIRGRQRARLERDFYRFAVARHGSLGAVLAAWGGEEADGDAPDGGRFGLYPVWHLTGKARTPEHGFSKGKARRVADQLAFWVETMRTWNRELARFVREELGAQHLLNFSNWRPADPARLMDLERHAADLGDVLALNRYVSQGHAGEHVGWAIVAGDRFQDRSLLFEPWHFPLSLKQVEGKATIVPESNWVPPLGHRSEGPFLVAAYMGLTGVDGFFWFKHGGPDVQFRQPGSANGRLPSLGKWVAATPDIAGGYPAAALLHRNGYVQRGRPAVVEHRRLSDLYRGRPPAIAELGSYDPNRDREQPGAQPVAGQPIDRLAFLVGPVLARYDAPESKTEVLDLQRFMQAEPRRIRSVTGELLWDYGAGLCTLDTPFAKGAAGVLRARSPIELQGLSIRSDNGYASALVVSLDGQPLAVSHHVLVQVVTRMRPTGFLAKPLPGEGPRPRFELVTHGRAPWQVEATRMVLALDNPHLSRAIALDMNLVARAELALQRDNRGVSLRMPEDAMYVILR